MREAFPLSLRSASALRQAPQRLVCEGAQGQQYSSAGKRSQFEGQVARTGVPLLWSRLVGWRRAAHCCGHPCPGQGETVVERPAERLVGVARTVQGREEEVTGAVSREHPPRPVASVGCRGKPDNHEPRVRIAEAGQRTRPVPFCEMGDRGVGRRVMAPSREPRTEGAVRHVPADLLQARGGRSHEPKATVSVVPTTRLRPPRPTVVCFVRHGTTATTGKVLPGRARGLHLSDQGRGEAERAGEALSGMSVSAVYASPLERARETASAISLSVGKPVVIERGLIECDFGTWTGESLSQLRKLPEWQAVRHTPSSFRFPEGESFPELQARVADTVARLRRAHPGEVVVAVSHADCIKVALASALGVPLDLFQRIVVAPCSISTVVYGSDGPTVLAMGALGAPAPHQASTRKRSR